MFGYMATTIKHKKKQASKLNKQKNKSVIIESNNNFVKAQNINPLSDIDKGLTE